MEVMFYLSVLKRLNGEDWPAVTCLFADDTVLLTESEEDLQRVANEFYNVCKRRKLKVNRTLMNKPTKRNKRKTNKAKLKRKNNYIKNLTHT